MFVVDGTNVCFWHKHYRTGKELPSVRPLLLLLCEIREHGDDFYCVFDHTIKDHMTSDREANLVEWLVRRYPNRFIRTAIDSRADPVILHYANKHGTRVISNDRYRDFFGQFEWLKKKNTTRLVQGNYDQSGLLKVEKMAYGYMELDSSAYTQAYVNRLIASLAPDFDWQKIHNAAEVVPSEPVSTTDTEKNTEKAQVVSLAAPKATTSKASSQPKGATTKSATKKTTVKAGKPAVLKTAKKARRTKPKALAKKVAVSKRKSGKKRKPPRVAPKKAAKPKSMPAKRRRPPPRKIGLLERLFGRLI